MPGAFKLDHLQPFKPILFWQISKIFTFILGGHFLLPQRANTEKREILPIFKRDGTQEFVWLGHSNWTNCNHLSSNFTKNVQKLEPLYWGFPFLITPERREGKWKSWKNAKVPTAPSVPRRSPIQVLTGPNIA